MRDSQDAQLKTALARISRRLVPRVAFSYEIETISRPKAAFD